VVQDHCRVVSVLGLGGIGKSALVVQAMRALASHFDVVLFRSLRDAPPPEALLSSCLAVLSPEAQDFLHESLERRLSRLLAELRSLRVLLVLDNLEALLEEGEALGRLRPGYEGYGQLLEQVGHTAHQSCLLCDYLALERTSGARLVCENEGFYALVPFWAVWPFEMIVISKEHLRGMDDLSESERTALADILKRITALYDKLFQVSFPYTMGFHQRPTDGEAHPEWHLHAHFYPPLLRSATIRKFMVGYELLGMPQRDITAESAAQRLRELQ